MIELHQLSFSYDQNPVLQNLSLQLKPGIFYGILGPNGQGKTTLIRLLARLIVPTSGSLTLNGIPYPQWERKAFARQVALLPQGRKIPEMTVENLVTFGRYPYSGLSASLSSADREAIHRGMEQTDTLPFASRELRNLSGGERQRAYLAMLLAQDTPYVFLDEPTTYLDIAGQFRILQLLTAMRNQGKCVAAVLHDLTHALEFCDRLLVLVTPDQIIEGSPAELVNSGLIDRVFGVRCDPLPGGGYHMNPH